MEEILSAGELVSLVKHVFRPTAQDEALAFLVDLPDETIPDNPKWEARRTLAGIWAKQLDQEKEKIGINSVKLFCYKNTHNNNADLPLAAWLHEFVTIPSKASDLAEIHHTSFNSIMSSHNLIIALTEFSASAPLKVAARTYHFRAASMPGFTTEMIPALRLDFTAITARVNHLKMLLDESEAAEIVFRVGEENSMILRVDLRHRLAHSSTGLFHEPGIVGNLPSGEAYIVPYEGERENDISRTCGLLPVQFNEEVVVYEVRENRAVSIISYGEVSLRESDRLNREPAYGNIAELGFGVLDDFGLEPIGENLLDEKLGLHIAFGRSDHFGGQVGPSRFTSPEAVVHIDRVYLNKIQPKIAVESVRLLRPSGQWLPLMAHGKYLEPAKYPFPQRDELLTEEEQYEAFSALLDACLRVNQYDDLLVISDETMQPYQATFWRLIQDRRLMVTQLHLPKSYQLSIADWVDSSQPEGPALPAGVTAAMQAASAVVTLLNNDLSTNKIRRAIVHRPRTANCRLAHIPGISADVLRAILKSPFEGIKKDCELVAWVLGEAEKIELISYDSLLRPYNLRLSMDGWNNEPFISSGIILRGSWGNVPPGETFCCPNPAKVSGSICINGSVPRYVVRSGFEVILNFESGKLVHWYSERESPACDFFDREKHASTIRPDENWNTFAELGIGLNPGITELTGNSLFDEKVMGTVHMAIGDNSIFGHSVVSNIHADLVTQNPSLIADGHPIIEKGTLKREGIEAWRNLQLSKISRYSDNSILYLREARISELDGVLVRRLGKGGRLGFVQMANREIGEALLDLYKILRQMGRVESLDLVAQYPQIRQVSTDLLLGILHHYRALVPTK
jgi:leucyl aminopeptidase (aminopeptidase T)